jgi:hypothetical protein
MADFNSGFLSLADPLIIPQPLAAHRKTGVVENATLASCDAGGRNACTSRNRESKRH